MWRVMAFQRPMAVPGVKMADFLRHAATNVRHPERKEGEELLQARRIRGQDRVLAELAQILHAHRAEGI